mgnify:CR=1 FL=1
MAGNIIELVTEKLSSLPYIEGKEVKQIASEINNF